MTLFKRFAAAAQPHPDPLFLFHCSMLWHQRADTSGGWELVQALRSQHPQTRLISATLLAKTKHARLMARDVRRAGRTAPTVLSLLKQPCTTTQKKAGAAMHTPYGLGIIEDCVSCRFRQDQWFCGLSLDSLNALSESSHLATYPNGAVLFVEGQTPRGAYVLCSGRVKLSTTSRDGKVLMLKVAEAGEVLGLSAVFTGESYEVTAETAMPCHVNFIERDTLFKLMGRNGEIGLRSSQALSREFQCMYRDVHDLVLARSSAGKLARLLLSWSLGPEHGREVPVRSSLTHEEMAQMIGASRETVTRLLSELKKKELIRTEGSTLVIRNRPALEALAA